MHADLVCRCFELSSLDAPLAIYRGRSDIGTASSSRHAEALAAHAACGSHTSSICARTAITSRLAGPQRACVQQLTLLPPSQAPGVLADLAHDVSEPSHGR